MGRSCVLAAKVTDLGDGQWSYEYALQNCNSDRSAGSFRIPIGDTAVQSIGFHDVAYHSGEPWDGTDWPPTAGDGAITWATTHHDENPNANALRWGTLYNFRFTAGVPPEPVSATIGLFKPGTPGSVTAPTQGPGPDCNKNAVADSFDIADGTSQDCENDGVPDECEPGVHLAKPDGHTPPNDHSLWRLGNNTSRHTFSCNIAAPRPGDIEIRELLDDGKFGPDLSASFTFTVEFIDTVEVIDAERNKPRRLRIRENGSVLSHRKWYVIQNVGGWAGVEPFCVHYQVQRGDADDSGDVNSLDVSAVNSGITTFYPRNACQGFPGRDDDRRDLNGDCRINSFDISVINGSLTSPPVPKPDNHPSCRPK